MKQKVIVSFRLRECDYQKIKDIADKNDRRPTELVRLIVESYLKSRDFV